MISKEGLAILTILLIANVFSGLIFITTTQYWIGIINFVGVGFIIGMTAASIIDQ